MSDVQRHVRELANPRYYAVDSATVIEIGDNVWQDTNDVKPASDFTWNVSLAQTQADFKAKYVGMSADRSRAGDTNDIGVDKNGIKKFTCASATFEIGDLVGPAKASGNALENQKVVAVASEDYAIGRVAKRYAAVTTEVEVDIRTFLDDFSNNDSTASIIANIEASGTLTADAIIDGTTNHVFTALDDTKLGGVEASADVTDATNVAAAGAVMDSDITPGEGFLRKTGSGAYTAHKSNLAADVAPTANDDNTLGYSVSSLWCDTTADLVYICIDATTGAAVWQQMMTAAQVSKLAGIEASADVTDATNVAAAGAFMKSVDDSDDITEGSTNLLMTIAERTKLASSNALKFFSTEYEAVADDDTAGYKDIDTGFAQAPNVVFCEIRRAEEDVKADAKVRKLGGGDAGKIRILDGAATYSITAGDIISLIAVDI